MKKTLRMVRGFFNDVDMYLGIFAEVAYVIGLSLVGFLICWALQRWV
jgi:hypothetical protein